MTRSSLLLGAALCLTTGALLGQALLPSAHAQDAPEATIDAPPSQPLDLRCKTFVVDADEGAEFRARDGSTEIGAWVREQEAEGWVILSADLEIGTKATGYPVAYNQVCLQNTP